MRLLVFQVLQVLGGGLVNVGGEVFIDFVGGGSEALVLVYLVKGGLLL